MRILVLIVLLSGCANVHVEQRVDKMPKITINGGFEPCHVRVKGTRRVNYNCEWKF